MNTSLVTPNKARENIMIYKDMIFEKAKEQPGFYWNLLVEMILIACAVTSIFIGDFIEALLIFILIELREIVLRIKCA